jgi:putative flippase GtrA
MVLVDARERTRFMKFMLVGLMGAVIDFGAFNLLSGLIDVPEVPASMISFTLAVCSNFVWNRFWTYPDSRSKRIRHQLIQFFIVNLLGVAIRTPIFAGLYTPLEHVFMDIVPPGLPFTGAFVGHNLALAVAVVVVMFWNFFVNRYWTYADID